jgi:RNA polymerase sigma-70 factor, ECF subfamily
MDATDRALPLSLLRAKGTLAPEAPEGVVSPRIFSDEQLLKAVCECDEGAALTLFRRYGKLAYSIGCRVLKDEGEAEDLTQEMFLRLCNEAHTFDGSKGTARTWIVQLLYRRAFDRRAFLRRRHFYTVQNSRNTRIL